MNKVKLFEKDGIVSKNWKILLLGGLFCLLLFIGSDVMARKSCKSQISTASMMRL